jgi:DNA-binding transcriptional LysR family regulator
MPGPPADGSAWVVVASKWRWRVRSSRTIRTSRSRGAPQGIGIIQLPDDQVAPYVRAKQIVPLLEDWAPRIGGLYLYHSSRRQVPPALEALIDFLRSHRTP